jgi:hypothetical protein
MKTRIMLVIEGQPAMMGRTLDVGADGVSMTLAQPLNPGQQVQLRFDLLVEGKLIPIHSKARTAYCILSNGDFKIGFQFLNLDLATSATLARYLR